jgi:FkbM family methyltransferase
MKLKEYIYMFGIKPKIKKYGYTIEKFNLPLFGDIEYAQWSHPQETKKYITDKDILYLKKFIKNGDFCVDVGAHSGDTSVPMSIAAGKEGLILALEPNQYVFPVLNKNSFLNKECTNIIPLMIASTEKDNDIVFEYSDSGFCNGGLHKNINKWKHGHAFNLNVTGANLNDLLHNKFNEKLSNLKYIKIDTEGFDLYVLESIEEIITKYRPYVKTEIFKHTDTNYRNSIYNFFSEKNYKVYKSSDSFSEYNKNNKLNIKDMNNWKHFDIFCVP